MKNAMAVLTLLILASCLGMNRTEVKIHEHVVLDTVSTQGKKLFLGPRNASDISLQTLNNAIEAEIFYQHGFSEKVKSCSVADICVFVDQLLGEIAEQKAAVVFQETNHYDPIIFSVDMTNGNGDRLQSFILSIRGPSANRGASYSGSKSLYTQAGFFIGKKLFP